MQLIVGPYSIDEIPRSQRFLNALSFQFDSRTIPSIASYETTKKHQHLVISPLLHYLYGGFANLHTTNKDYEANRIKSDRNVNGSNRESMSRNCIFTVVVVVNVEKRTQSQIKLTKKRVWNDSHDNLFDLLFELDCLFLLVFLFRKPFALSFFGLVWRGVYTFFPSSVLVLFYTCIRIAVDIHTKIFYNEALTTILVYKFNSTKSFICCCCFLRSRRVSVALFTFFFAVSGCILAASVNSTLAVLLFRCSHTKKKQPACNHVWLSRSRPLSTLWPVECFVVTYTLTSSFELSIHSSVFGVFVCVFSPIPISTF